MVSTGGVGTGLSHARNTGLAAAKANIIALLDADDVFYPEKLARMVPYAEVHGFCTCAMDYVRYDENGRTVIRDFGVTGDSRLLTPDMYLTVNISSNAMIVFDRNRIPVTWREDFPVMEDSVFSMTAFEYIPAIYHIGRPLHEYVYTKNSLSTSPEAPGRFIAAKKRIVELLDEETLGIKNPLSIAAFKRFVAISMKTEYAYAKAMQAGESITFLELLENALKETKG